MIFKLVELVGEPGGGASRSIVAAAKVLLDVGSDVRVDDPGGELRVGRFETDVHQVAVGNTLDTEATQEPSEFGGAFLVCEAADGNGFRGPIRERKTPDEP